MIQHSTNNPCSQFFVIHSGAALAPKVFEDFGRKKCLYAASIVFILGASLQAAAWTMTVMQVARIFSGEFYRGMMDYDIDICNEMGISYLKSTE